MKGSYLDLSSPWSLQTKLIPEIIEDSAFKPILRNTNKFGRYFKNIDFFILIPIKFYEIDASEIPRDLIGENLIVSWLGGLNPQKKTSKMTMFIFKHTHFLVENKKNLK